MTIHDICQLDHATLIHNYNKRNYFHFILKQIKFSGLYINREYIVKDTEFNESDYIYDYIYNSNENSNSQNNLNSSFANDNTPKKTADTDDETEWEVTIIIF